MPRDAPVIFKQFWKEHFLIPFSWNSAVLKKESFLTIIEIFTQNYWMFTKFTVSKYIKANTHISGNINIHKYAHFSNSHKNPKLEISLF